MNASDVRRVARDLGLERVADHIASLVRPAIRLEHGDGPGETTSSKLGGLPNLPPDVTWPEWKGRPLAHLAQIRLSEVKAFDHEALLPSAGVLWFFWDSFSVAFYRTGEEYGDLAGWGYKPDDKGSAAVRFHEADSDLHPSSHPKLVPEAVLPEWPVVPLSEVTLPPFDSVGVEELGLSKSELDAYVELAYRVWNLQRGSGKPSDHDLSPNHRLLGHPDQIQDDMAVECELVTRNLNWNDYEALRDQIDRSASEWRLLLQVGSDEERLDVLWGDVGRLYFWIREQDLASRNYDLSWLILQCG